MEKAWSPADRTVNGVMGRTAAQGARWLFSDTNFYVDPEIEWTPAVIGTEQSLCKDRSVDAAVASVAVPGADPSEFEATIEWGDGTPSQGEVVGEPPAHRVVNSVFEVEGSHTYDSRGRFSGNVTVTGPHGLELEAPFEAGPARGSRDAHCGSE